MTRRHVEDNAAQLEFAKDGLVRLTAREREVLDLIVDGWNHKEIGVELGISPRTVETHRQHASLKLGARNLADLVRVIATLRERWAHVAQDERWLASMPSVKMN